MEVAQQVVTEILEAALDGPTVPARWSPNRLLTLATRGTHRWLAREARSLGETSRLEDEPEDNQARELVSMIAERARRERRTFGFDVLYRQEVLGESVARIAAEMGVSENTLRLRRRRAIQKLRRELAA
jgi:DNA-directed RNA polymerase specialized sigma24 family protein